VVDVAHTGNNRDNEDEGDRKHRDGTADTSPDTPAESSAEASAEPDSKSGTDPDADSDGDPTADSTSDSAGGAATASRTGSRHRKRKRPRSFWRELPILIGVALLLALLIQTFVARVFVIPSESMERTLHGCPGCYGDRVLVDKLVYDFGDPEPGEVVVFKRPGTWNQSEFESNRSSNAFVSWLQDVGAAFGLASPDEDDVVKRIIAVGGQRVECCDDKNRVVVDGKPLDEPYIYWTPNAERRQAAFAPITVPDGMMFVMGDNRNNSSDSRYQGGGGRNGLVPVDNVIGKVRWIVLPPSRWQGVGDHDPQGAATASAMGAAVDYGVPLGGGLLAAWPLCWLGRRVRTTVRKAVRAAGDEP
jgi:signal peptidase I